MASSSSYKCLNCKGLFTARTADRARGWAKFCSKRCKAVEQERRTGQYARLKESYDHDHEVDCSHPGWDEHKEWI